MSTPNNFDNASADGFWHTPSVNLNEMEAGTVFQATWGYTNTGTTTWDSRYKFAYTLTPHPKTTDYARSPMTTPTTFSLTDLGAPATVPPGATVRLTLTLTAPTSPATHATNWQLQNPDGQRFGPIRWARLVVKEEQQTTIINPVNPLVDFKPENWRSAIFAITSTFESGSPQGRPNAYQNADAGIVSYGKHQATLQSGNLEQVLNNYFRLSNSATSQALEQEYAQRVASKDESLRHDVRFKELLLQAAQEPEMTEAQEQVFEQRFYRPTITRANQLGIKTPLGLATLYDTQIQGGLVTILELVAEKLGTPGPSATIDESTWIATFLNEREAWLKRIADNKEKAGDGQSARFLRNSTFRVTELRQLLNSGNLTLTDEFTVRGQRIKGIRAQPTIGSASGSLGQANKPDQPKPEQPKPPETIDLLPYLKGDGRQYEIKNAWGSQERVQTQADSNFFYHVKNAQWEQFFHDDNFIYRDIDTSPGNNRFYRQKDADLPRGSRWLPRYMAIGDTHTQARQVQFYNKADGSRSEQNSGGVTDTIKLITHHAKYRFQTGIELHDVIELEWVNGRERYFYAKNYGLVGWKRNHDDPHTPPWSAISEIHQPGTRTPYVRESVSVV